MLHTQAYSLTKLDVYLQCQRRRDVCLPVQALSADGRCKTFDSSADGYGRGEGFAVAYLTPSASSSRTLALFQVCSYATAPLCCIKKNFLQRHALSI